MTLTLAPATAVLLLLSMAGPAFTPALQGPDHDRDGVEDALDLCRDTPAGYPADEFGCARDEDGDGVADGADLCPGTRRASPAVDEPVDATGCSSRDSKKERSFPYSLQTG